MSPHERILVALDFPDAEPAVALARRLIGRVGGFKVGLELINAAGFDVFARLQDVGVERIFYDAKFHDIPNTVAGAVRAAARRGVWMVNVHAAGGSAMLRAAREAAGEGGGTPPLLIGVTLLTSIDANALRDDLGVGVGVDEYVEHLARRCEQAGLDGVVCSPHEVKRVRASLGRRFLTVVPGVRPAGVGADDQVRLATPGAAVSAGAHYLVVGRAITGAPDPVEAAGRIAEEIEQIEEDRGQ
jgi:orotidine-5'-phosphate decarboxylase